MHSGGFELTKLTYTRLEDNLIRHRGDRLIYTTPTTRGKRLILTHGLQKEPTPKHSSRRNLGVTPLPVPFLVLGSRVILCMENWMEIQTSLRNHEDHKDTPSRQPRPPPEDRPISSTYPVSQKKTAISRTEAQKVAAAEQEEAERRAAAHQRRAIPQVRYDTYRSCSEHAHRTSPNTQRQQHAAV